MSDYKFNLGDMVSLDNNYLSKYQYSVPKDKEWEVVKVDDVFHENLYMLESPPYIFNIFEEGIKDSVK